MSILPKTDLRVIQRARYEQNKEESLGEPGEEICSDCQDVSPLSHVQGTSTQTFDKVLCKLLKSQNLCKIGQLRESSLIHKVTKDFTTKKDNIRSINAIAHRICV